jgi:hypothetical protein
MWEDDHSREKYIQELIDGAIFFVEATSYEQQCLWVENVENYKSVKSFEHETPYFTIEIGKYKGQPMYVELGFELIDGQRVGFYHPCGNIVNREMVNDWAKKVVGSKKYDKKSQMGDGNYGRRSMCDAWNFNHCLCAIHEANEAKNKEEGEKIK